MIQVCTVRIQEEVIKYLLYICDLYRYTCLIRKDSNYSEAFSAITHAPSYIERPRVGSTREWE